MESTLNGVEHQKITANHKKQTSRVNDLRTLLCVGRCENLGSLKSCLKYSSSVACFPLSWIPVGYTERWGRGRSCTVWWLQHSFFTGPAGSILFRIFFFNNYFVVHTSSEWLWISLVQFSHSVVSNSLQPPGLNHARPPCPSPTPGVYSNSSPLSWWYHPTISSSVGPFSSHLQSFPASGSFPMSQFFALGGQSIGVSASSSVLPMDIQDLFPLGWTSWISLQSQGLSRGFSNTTVQKHHFFGT